MAKIPRDSNLFNNILNCLRKVTRVDIEKYGRTDPIQKFVNKTTDEMTQDICFLMDEVTSNLESMYTEIKHIFSYYNNEMEKIASTFHEKNLCQKDPGELQAELAKSVTDLNTKAESLKSDLLAQQSEFQKYIHEYISTLQEKSERNYQILNKFKLRQRSLVEKQVNSESIKDMIENYTKPDTLQFTSASMSTLNDMMFTSKDTQTPSKSKINQTQKKSKLDLENTSKNLEEICKKLKLTSKSLENKSDLHLESESRKTSSPSDSENKLESLKKNDLDNDDNQPPQKVILAITNNLDSDNNEKFEITNREEVNSEKKDFEKHEKKVKSSKISDRLPPDSNDGISFEEDRKISVMIDKQKQLNDNERKFLKLREKEMGLKLTQKQKSVGEDRSLKQKESRTAVNLPQRSKTLSEKFKSNLKMIDQEEELKPEIVVKNLKPRVCKVKASENIPNQVEKKLNDLNNLLSFNREQDKDEKIMSRTSSLHDDNNKKNFNSQKQLLPRDSKNFIDDFEYQKQLIKKATNFSASDTILNKKRPSNWNLQSATNSVPSSTPAPSSLQPCCAPPAPTCPPEPDYCSDNPCDPCEKDESHGSVKYDLFEKYLCLKSQPTRYMDYLESVKKGLTEKNLVSEHCNQYIMSHTEFLEAIDTRAKLLRSIEKHREIENESRCLEPSALEKLKAKVACKLGVLKTTSAVTNSNLQAQQNYPNEAGKFENHQQYYYPSTPQSLTEHSPTIYPVIEHLENQQQRSQSLPPVNSKYPHVEAQYGTNHHYSSSDVPTINTVPSNIITNNSISFQPVTTLPQPPTVEDQSRTTDSKPYFQLQQPISISQPLSTKQQYTYSKTQPTTNYNQDSNASATARPDKFFSEFTDAQFPVKLDPVTQTEAKSEQYGHSEAQPTAKQTQFAYSTLQPEEIKREQYYVELQSTAKPRQYNFIETSPETKQEQYNYSEAPPNMKRNEHFYPDAQYPTNQEQKAFSSSSQPSTKHEAYPYPVNQHGEKQKDNIETQPAAQQPNVPSQTQSTQQQYHIPSPTQSATQQQYIVSQPSVNKENSIFHSSSESQALTGREPYNHLEVEPTPEEKAAIALSIPQLTQPPVAAEKFIYPEQQPFEPKPSPMRHHIEQKIAAATKPIVETPQNTILPVKSMHIHENLPIRKSVSSLTESNSKTNSTSETPQNSKGEFTSETASLPHLSQLRSIQSKYSEPTLRSRRNSFAKFDVKTKSINGTSSKRLTFNNKNQESNDDR